MKALTDYRIRPHLADPTNCKYLVSSLGDFRREQHETTVLFAGEVLKGCFPC